ncbi:MAG: amino acid adenylation domain-containing protein, partial [Planctomycetota bacterium]
MIAAASMSDDANTAYNEAVSLRIDGSVDVDGVERALYSLVGRHDALRSTFTPQLNYLCVTSHNHFKLERVDLTNVTCDRREGVIAEHWREMASTQMSLCDGPLFRAVWLQLDEDLAELVLLAHHAVCDGWSFQVILNELATLYGEDAPDGLPPAPSFAEFAALQHSREKADPDAAYWTDRFDDRPDALDLPTDRPRPQGRTFAAQRLDYVISEQSTGAIGRAAVRMQTSNVGLLVAGVATLLHRLTGAEDVVLGMPVARQALDDLPGLVGHCVQLLPLRLTVESTASFEQMVDRSRSAVLDASEHFDFTFGSLVRGLGYSGDATRVPLIPVLLNVDQPLPQLRFGAAKVTVRSVPRTAEGFELFLNIAPSGAVMVVEATFNSDLFERDTIAAWLRALELLLVAAVEAPAQALGSLDLTEPGDTAIHAAGPERTRTHGSWLELLLRAAEEQPTAVAVVDDKGAMTYAELVQRGRTLADELAAIDVAVGNVVGVATGRSRDLLTAIVGTHLAGAAHLPLDPGYPAARLQHMVVDSGASVIVVDSDPPSQLLESGVRILDLRLLAVATTPAAPTPLRSVGADDFAYIIYTSGSTGVPKGVRVSHGNLVNLLEAVADRPGFGVDDVMLAVTTISFDISLLELLLPLTVGGRLVVARRDESEDPRVLAHLLKRHAVTIMQATPATWRLLVEDGWTGQTLLTAFCGGERLPPDLAAKLLPRVRALWNLYGPTETTIWSSVAEVTAAAQAALVGTPLDNTDVYILDGGLGALPMGVPGEICIGGAGVAQGYHHRRDLTAERFLEHPQLGRLYRTGDRGRIRPDGQIECFGRLDQQIKLRGFRIELSEIESVLLSHPDVADTTVVVRGDSNTGPRLVAYIVARSQDVDVADVRAYLQSSLPEYMVPQQVVSLTALPRLPNGKLNRRGLPPPETLEVGDEYDSSPRGELEALVCDSMAALLGADRIGAEQNFFAAGGHSLLAAQLVARLNRAKDCDLTMRAIFEAPTPRQLAAAIGARRGSATQAAPIPRRADRGLAPATMVQERIWFLEQMLGGRPTYNLPSAHRLCGPFDRAAFERALAEVVRRQASLRTTFERRNGTLLQFLHGSHALELPVTEDLLPLPAEERSGRLMARLEELTAQSFDLASLPLYRAQLFRIDVEEHVLFFMPHHIIWDGWSFDVLYDELSQLYSAFAAGRPSPLPLLSVEYGDFAAWQRERQALAAAQPQLEAWRSRFEK